MKTVNTKELVRKTLLIIVCGLTCNFAAWDTDGFQSTRESTVGNMQMEVNPTSLSQTKGYANTELQNATSCEYALAVLDDSVIRVRELKDTRLIIIARLGKGESSRRLSWARLGLIEKSYLGRFPDVKYVTAEGTRVKGFGVIEIYVGGRLLYTLPIEKNAKAFCVYKSKNDVS